MSVERIATRYAKSLIDLAVEQGKLERIREDMLYFLEAVKVRDLYLLLKSPIVHVGTKRTIVRQLFSSLFDELSYAFLDIILRKGREAYLPDIARAFMDQYRVIMQISQVRLTTATPFSEDKIEEIKQKIREAHVTAPNIEVEAHVDPKILGGFILEFENKLYDASVSHQLDEMRKVLLQEKYDTNN